MNSLKNITFSLLAAVALLAQTVSCKEKPAFGRTTSVSLVGSMTLEEKLNLLTVSLNEYGMPDSTHGLHRLGIPSVRFVSVPGFDHRVLNSMCLSRNTELAFQYGQCKSLEKRLASPGALEIALLDASFLEESELPYTILRSIAEGMSETGGIVALMHRQPECDSCSMLFGHSSLKLALSDSASQVLASLRNGNDLFACLSSDPADAIADAVNEGLLTGTDLDRKVTFFLDCLSDYLNGNPEPFELPDIVCQPGLLERECARQGAVLIRNENTLPFVECEAEHIALYGLTSYDSSLALDRILAGSSFRLEPAVCNMYRHLLQLPDSTARSGSLDRKPFQYRADAIQTDVAVIAVSGDCSWNSKLIADVSEAFHFKSRKVVLVLDEQACQSLSDCIGLADAALVVSWVGSETSKAVSDILKGDLNPSGKLFHDIPGNGGLYSSGFGLNLP